MAEESFHIAKRAACVKGTDVHPGVATSGTGQEDVQLLQDRLDCLRIDSDRSRDSNEASKARRRWKESANESKACDTRMDGEREWHLTPA